MNFQPRLPTVKPQGLYFQPPKNYSHLYWENFPTKTWGEKWFTLRSSLHLRYPYWHNRMTFSGRPVERCWGNIFKITFKNVRKSLRMFVVKRPALTQQKHWSGDLFRLFQKNLGIFCFPSRWMPRSDALWSRWVPIFQCRLSSCTNEDWWL